MKIGIEWSLTGVNRSLLRLAINPRCQASLHDNRPCGRLATMRMTNPGSWSLFWCPLHFWPRGSSDEEWTRYWRLFPDALDRALVDALPA